MTRDPAVARHHVRYVATLLSVCAVLLTACSSGSRGSPSTGDEFTLPSDSKSIAPGGRSVTGTLGFDDIEGGCAYIEAADGTRYEVIYPAGWTLDQGGAQLRGPDGQVANAGEPVTVRGSLATDRSSTCQIGPIFAATSVEISPD